MQYRIRFALQISIQSALQSGNEATRQRLFKDNTKQTDQAQVSHRVSSPFET
ncbi:hypothetical protein N9D38_11665 [Rubripirellula sp.]|jgi:hypothetical protein|nr:hypothetical protein [Rubripirellula sp.]